MVVRCSPRSRPAALSALTRPTLLSASAHIEDAGALSSGAQRRLIDGSLSRCGFDDAPVPDRLDRSGRSPAENRAWRTTPTTSSTASHVGLDGEANGVPSRTGVVTSLPGTATACSRRSTPSFRLLSFDFVFYKFSALTTGGTLSVGDERHGATRSARDTRVTKIEKAIFPSSSSSIAGPTARVGPPAQPPRIDDHRSIARHAPLGAVPRTRPCILHNIRPVESHFVTCLHLDGDLRAGLAPPIGVPVCTELYVLYSSLEPAPLGGR